jgi:hypothetical protein
MTGEGEDVTYQAEMHDGVPGDLMLAGTWTLDDLSRRLDEAEPLAEGYRRWAFESAALDLALRQNELGLGEALGREERPVRFVVSTRAAPERWLEFAPGLEFKLDAETDWDRRLLRRLRELGRVRVVDLKGLLPRYERRPCARPRAVPRHRRGAPRRSHRGRLAGGRPARALAGAEDRLSFDAPIHSLADLDDLAARAALAQHQAVALRHGARAARDDRGVRGARDPDVRRRPVRARPGPLQIQRLASVFYPDGPNDVAPSAYNEGEPREGLPQSPLPPREEPGSEPLRRPSTAQLRR